MFSTRGSCLVTGRCFPPYFENVLKQEKFPRFKAIEMPTTPDWWPKILTCLPLLTIYVSDSSELFKQWLINCHISVIKAKNMLNNSQLKMMLWKAAPTKISPRCQFSQLCVPKISYNLVHIWYTLACPGFRCFVAMTPHILSWLVYYLNTCIFNREDLKIKLVCYLMKLHECISHKWLMTVSQIGIRTIRGQCRSNLGWGPKTAYRVDWYFTSVTVKDVTSEKISFVKKTTVVNIESPSL